MASFLGGQFLLIFMHFLKHLLVFSFEACLYLTMSLWPGGWPFLHWVCRSVHWMRPMFSAQCSSASVEPSLKLTLSGGWLLSSAQGRGKYQDLSSSLSRCSKPGACPRWQQLSPPPMNVHREHMCSSLCPEIQWQTTHYCEITESPHSLHTSIPQRVLMISAPRACHGQCRGFLSTNYLWVLHVGSLQHACPQGL